MAGERLEIAPRGRWEKIAARSSGWLLFVPVFTSNLFVDALGFWGSLGLAVGVTGLGALVLIRLALPERKERLARDARRGIFECAIRYPDSQPGSLRDRWLPGFAEVSPSAVRFQPDLSGEAKPAGVIRSFNSVVLKGAVEPPAKRPAELQRGWGIVALDTDEGPLHVAAGENGLRLLEERLGNRES